MQTRDNQDAIWMGKALQRAELGLGRTAPNPAVGAVIVKNGRLLSSGWHRRAGGPHAEIEAIRALPVASDGCGATLYVTLEPCSTFGRTPPCCHAIVAAQFARVVIGTLDPNPAHAGAALKILRDAGLEVCVGVREPEARSLIRGFANWMMRRRPWVIAKFAMSLDGKIATAPGTSPQISAPAAMRFVHELRNRVDAILVGAGTLRMDNPRLTARTASGRERGRQPLRVIASGKEALPSDRLVFTDAHRENTLVLPGAKPCFLLDELGRRGIHTVLVEGGGQWLGSLLDENLIDEIVAIVSPIFLGGDKPAFGGLGASGNEEARGIEEPVFKKLGPDLILQGRLKSLP